MPVYTTVAKVRAELPSGEPTGYTTETWNTKLGELIAERSQYVDDGVGGAYSFSYKTNTQKFPDITDSAATPSSIEVITRYFVASDAMGIFGGSYNVGDPTPKTKLRQKAEAQLKEIHDGKTSISLSGVSLRSSFLYTTNDRPTDQDDPDFDRDELDNLYP